MDIQVSIQIHAQKEWIAAHGGDLLGYREAYGEWTDADVDAIYRADIDTLHRLEGVPQDVIDHNHAVRVLGDNYFA